MNIIEVASAHLDQPQSPTRIALPSFLGKDLVTRESFQSGMQLRVIKSQFNDVTEVKYNTDGFSVGFGFCLNGSFESRSSCFKNSMKGNSNMSGIFHYPEISDISMKVDSNPMEHFTIVMDTEHLLGLIENVAKAPLSIVKKIEKKEPFIIPDVLTPSMCMVLHQICNCPFTGKLREIFIEGKLMELLSYKLYQLHDGKNSVRQSRNLTSADVERIRYAAELLIRDLENPPDIATIATMVGLSKSTLYRNFNKVFNMSPCGYLRDQRLHAAMQLLQSSESSVTEAAFLVGYSSLSHFTKAFKALFGISPSDFQNSPTFEKQN